MTNNIKIHRTRYPVLAILALLACGLAGWLGFLSAVGLEIPGCGGSNGCVSVMFTRWAQWFGVPVSFLAAGLYLLVAGLSLTPAGQECGRRHRILMFAHEVLPMIIGLAIIWFIGLQLLGVGEICPYCLADHGLGLLVALLLWRRRFKESPRSATTGRFHWEVSLLTSVSAFIVLLTGQFLGSLPETHAVSHYVYGKGRIRITSADAPVLGNHDAPQVALELFDYTCPTCRQLAPQLSAAIERYDGQFAVLLVPCPIERKCNPFLLSGAVEHTNACAYARSGMAVWVAAPDKFPQFHEWLILTDPIPTLEQTCARASELVGSETYKRALQDHRIDRLIDRGIDLYRGMRQGVMPKLLLGDRMIQGVPSSADKLYEGLESNLPLKPTQPQSIQISHDQQFD